MKYALDANVIVHYLRKELNVLSNFDNAAIRNCELIIPKVVDYEIRRGFSIYPAPRKETAYEILTQQCRISEIGHDVWDCAILVYMGLYHKRLTVGEMDILIAAFCLINDYTLVTNNTDDFININGLSLVDWTQPQL